MSPITSYSEQSVCHVLTTAQIEFWAREFRFSTYVPGLEIAKKLIKENKIPIVEIRDGIEAYSHLPEKSIIALLNADEKYDCNLFE